MSTATESCIHCWHSDPLKKRDVRWFCCHCDEERFQTSMDVKECYGCYTLCFPNPFGFCLMCTQVIDTWLSRQMNAHGDDYLQKCIAEYIEDQSGRHGQW